MQNVLVKDIGPITELTIPVPNEGIVVMQGPHGVGKSTTLAALETAATGRGRLTPRDGSPYGVVEGWGVRLRVGRNQRRTGTAEVDVPTERFSIDDFIDPGLKDPEKNNSKRVRIAVAMAGVQPSTEPFAKSLGGDELYAKYVGIEPEAKDDVVSFAEKVKRALEAKAREAASSAAGVQDRIKAISTQVDGIDTSVEHDEDVLQSRLESALAENAKLQQQAAEADRRMGDAEEAKAALASVSHDGPDSAELEVEAEEGEQKADSIRKHIASLKQQLRDTEAALQKQVDHVAAIRKTAEAIRRTEMLKEKWQKQVDAAEAIMSPSIDQLEAAQERVKESRKAIEAGALIRQALRLQDDRDRLKPQWRHHHDLADFLRREAQATDRVISDAMGSLGVKFVWHQGMLCLATDRSETELFDDLSDGEKSLEGVRMLVALSKPGSVLFLSQSAWEGWNTEFRNRIADMLRGTGVCIVTAEVTDGHELTFARWSNPEGDQDVSESPATASGEGASLVEG